MQDIGFKDGGTLISSGQVAVLIAFLVVLAAVAIYLRRKPKIGNFFAAKPDQQGVVVERKNIGPGVTWFKVDDGDKRYIFVDNGQHLLKLDECKTQKERE